MVRTATVYQAPGYQELLRPQNAQSSRRGRAVPKRYQDTDNSNSETRKCSHAQAIK